jgi:hypothetical protein
MLGNIGIILVIGGLAAVAMGALKKFEFDTEAEFKLGDYKTEVEFEFEVDKTGKKKKHRRKGKGDTPNPEGQPNQIDPDRPMLVPENIDMFPYYNRFILW